jgi:hypothetical protein
VQRSDGSQMAGRGDTMTDGGAAGTVSADGQAPSWAWYALGVGGVLATGIAAGYRPAAGVVLVAAVAVGFVLLRDRVMAGVVLAGLVPVVSGLKRGLVVPGFRLSEIMIMGIGLLILATVPKRRTVPWRLFDWLALGYAVATALLGWLDVTSRGVTLSSSDVGTLLGPLQYLILYRAMPTSLQSREAKRRGLRFMILMSPVVSLLAIAQQLNLPGVRSLLTVVTGVQLYGANPSEGGLTLTIPPRASGPFPFWHETGGYLMMIVLLIVGLLLTDANRTVARKWLGVILILDCADRMCSNWRYCAWRLVWTIT